MCKSTEDIQEMRIEKPELKKINGIIFIER
jgi:hypothetical protein